MIVSHEEREKGRFERSLKKIAKKQRRNVYGFTEMDETMTFMVVRRVSRSLFVVMYVCISPHL